MNIKTAIPTEILTAVTAMLQHYVADLSPNSLRDALKSYNNDASIPVRDTKPLTRHDCADLLGVSVSSINRYIKQGRIRAKKISARLIRIDRQSVMDLLNCNHVEA